VRRRTRPKGVFINAESAERIMCGVTEHLNANWQAHPLRQIQSNALRDRAVSKEPQPQGPGTSNTSTSATPVGGCPTPLTMAV
jgi:hypothetical protein